jgi:hypothetical protein
VFFIGAMLLLHACRKPDPDLGLDLLPGDPLGVSGTATPLHAFTFEGEPVRTSGLTRNLLGSYVDPQFGRVRAGIVAQLRLSSVNVGVNLTDPLAVDSLVLSLAFDGAGHSYGTLGPQRFQVFELAQDLSVDATYQTDDVPEVVPVDLVRNRGGRITPRPLNFVQLATGDSLLPQLRIRLADELAARFMNEFGQPGLVDNSSFLQFFKGLYVTVDNGMQLPVQEGILYLNLLNSASKATLYYHNESTGALGSYDFPINENSVRYTVVEFDRQQTMIPGLAQALADTVSPAETVYVQALGGLRTAIRFPDIMQHAVPGRALSKAELIVPLQGTFNPYLPPPSQMFLFRRDEAGEDDFLPDQLGGVGNIDGSWRPATRDYRFNITRYVQGVLNGDIPDNGIELVAGSSGISANRAILAGPAAGDGMKLLLTFATY